MSAEAYLKAVFVDHLLEGNFMANAAGKWLQDNKFTDRLIEDFQNCFASYGYVVDNASKLVAVNLIEELTASGVIEADGDQYSGKFLNFKSDAFKAWAKTYKASDEFAMRIRRLGDDAVAQALVAISSERMWGVRSPWLETEIEMDEPGYFELIRAPASDRVVYLNDNQIHEIDSAANEVFEVLEKENSIDGDVGERSRILAQIEGARAFIRAGSVRAYLMYQALVAALAMLIEKYRGKALGQVASKLLDLLIEHIFSGGK